MQHVTDAPSAIATATDTLDLPLQRPVVVTLVHGTVLFARWPRVLKLLTVLEKLWPNRQVEPAWYTNESKFVTRLTANLGPLAQVVHYTWSGGNSVWERIHAAGAEEDFGQAVEDNPRSLRNHIAQIAEDHPGATQVLVAHSHGGNVCQYALRKSSTASCVSALVCLSTPFVHARRRVDSSVLDNTLRVLLGILYLAVFFVASQWMSSRVPEPWDSVIFSVLFTLVIFVGVFWWARRERRRNVLRWWADSVAAEPQPDGPPMLVLLADADEALLALKIAEAFNVMSRGLWRMTYSISQLLWRTRTSVRQRQWLYGGLSLVTLVILVLTDAQSPLIHPEKMWSFVQVLKFLAASALIPLFLALILVLAFMAPALVAMLIGYPVLMFSRWLAFGWGGSIGVDVTAEACPLGTATVTRLGPSNGSSGLQHTHPYHHQHAPVLIAKFIAETTGLKRRAAV
jgi:hypothetical protein